MWPPYIGAMLELYYPSLLPCYTSARKGWLMQSMAEARSAGSKASIGTSQSEKAGGAGVRTGLWRHFTFGLALVPLVLLSEHVIQRPRLQLGDVPQLARLPEVFLGVLACTQGEQLDIVLGFSNKKEWRGFEALLCRIVNSTTLTIPQIT